MFKVFLVCTQTGNYQRTTDIDFRITELLSRYNQSTVGSVVDLACRICSYWFEKLLIKTENTVEYFSSSFFIDIHFLTVVKHILLFVKSSLCDHLISDILYICQSWL